MCMHLLVLAVRSYMRSTVIILLGLQGNFLLQCREWPLRQFGSKAERLHFVHLINPWQEQVNVCWVWKNGWNDQSNMKLLHLLSVNYHRHINPLYMSTACACSGTVTFDLCHMFPFFWHRAFVWTHKIKVIIDRSFVRPRLSPLPSEPAFPISPWCSQSPSHHLRTFV